MRFDVYRTPAERVAKYYRDLKEFDQTGYFTDPVFTRVMQESIKSAMTHFGGVLPEHSYRAYRLPHALAPDGTPQFTVIDHDELSAMYVLAGVMAVRALTEKTLRWELKRNGLYAQYQKELSRSMEHVEHEAELKLFQELWTLQDGTSFDSSFVLFRRMAENYEAAYGEPIDAGTLDCLEGYASRWGVNEQFDLESLQVRDFLQQKHLTVRERHEMQKKIKEAMDESRTKEEVCDKLLSELTEKPFSVETALWSMGQDGVESPVDVLEELNKYAASTRESLHDAVLKRAQALEIQFPEFETQELLKYWSLRGGKPLSAVDMAAAKVEMDYTLSM